MSFFKNKNILVAGGTGMIGRYLVDLLIEQKANISVVSLDNPLKCWPQVTFLKADLRDFKVCLEVCKNKDIVFNLAGVKGSPAMSAQKPASFFVPTLMFSINMMEAARQCAVGHYLYTSSIGVYQPKDILKEDDVWQTFPSKHDRFAGWAKRMGELQAQAYAIENSWDNISIVRPANVYGAYDNFDAHNAMVIPSLIRRICDGENPLKVWGDGSAVRDFIHAKDVARGMMMMVEKGVNEPVNLGSGEGISIKELVETLESVAGQFDVIWDTSQPQGDSIRLMDTTRAQRYGFKPQISLKEGIKDTWSFYRKNDFEQSGRYNVFTQGLEVA